MVEGIPNSINISFERFIPESWKGNGFSKKFTPSSGQRINRSIKIKESVNAISMNGLTLINESEVFAIVAAPGAGKTNLIEAIIAKYIAAKNNIEVDSFGISINITKKKILVLDFERPEQDVRLSLERICNRIDVENNPGLWDGDDLKDLDIFRFLDVQEMDKRKEAFQECIDSNEYDMIIIDGMLELVPSMNDERAIKDFFSSIRSSASTHNINFIVTIHSNRGSSIPQGHIGGYIVKYARAVLHIKANENDRSVKEIYFDQTYGKLSHCDPTNFIPSFMIWDIEKGFFVSADAPKVKPKLGFNLEALIQVYKGKRTLKLQAGYLQQKYLTIVGIGIETARKHIKAATNAERLNQIQEGSKYFYSIDENLLKNEDA